MWRCMDNVDPFGVNAAGRESGGHREASGIALRFPGQYFELQRQGPGTAISGDLRSLHPRQIRAKRSPLLGVPEAGRKPPYGYVYQSPLRFVEAPRGLAASETCERVWNLRGCPKSCGCRGCLGTGTHGIHNSRDERFGACASLGRVELTCKTHPSLESTQDPRVRSCDEKAGTCGGNSSVWWLGSHDGAVCRSASRACSLVAGWGRLERSPRHHGGSPATIRRQLGPGRAARASGLASEEASTWRQFAAIHIV